MQASARGVCKMRRGDDKDAVSRRARSDTDMPTAYRQTSPRLHKPSRRHHHRHSDQADSDEESSSDETVPRLDVAKSRLFRAHVDLAYDVMQRNDAAHDDRRARQLSRAHSSSPYVTVDYSPRQRVPRLLLSRALDHTVATASYADRRQLFVAMVQEPNAVIRNEAQLLCQRYSERQYADEREFKQAYLEWRAEIDVLRQVSLEFWIKEHYMTSLWMRALEAAQLGRALHRGDQDAYITDPIADSYISGGCSDARDAAGGVRWYRHRVPLSSKQQSRSLFLILYTDGPQLERRTDWRIEQAELFWNCFFCIPPSVNSVVGRPERPARSRSMSDLKRR